MTSNYEYLLIGNTRLHWAKKISGRYSFKHSPLDHPFPDELISSNLFWASVANYETSFLKQDNELTIKDIGLRNIPKYFGIDRALGCSAALQITKNPHQKNIVVADFGTTLSITKINSEGYLIGGQLIPGFYTQLKSMVASTKNLTMPTSFNIPKDNFSIDTQESMIKGVHHALVGAINLACDQDKDILIICGGDSEMMEPYFSEQSDFFINTNLVLKGMIMLHEKHPSYLLDV